MGHSVQNWSHVARHRVAPIPPSHSPCTITSLPAAASCSISSQFPLWVWSMHTVVVVVVVVVVDGVMRIGRRMGSNGRIGSTGAIGSTGSTGASGISGFASVATGFPPIVVLMDL